MSVGARFIAAAGVESHGPVTVPHRFSRVRAWLRTQTAKAVFAWFQGRIHLLLGRSPACTRVRAWLRIQIAKAVFAWFQGRIRSLLGRFPGLHQGSGPG
jgi:hypothetical protein